MKPPNTAEIVRIVTAAVPTITDARMRCADDGLSGHFVCDKGGLRCIPWERQDSTPMAYYPWAPMAGQIKADAVIAAEIVAALK